MGTNKPVKITDAKSGLIRRLIDVTPSGNKLNPKEYKRIFKQASFELGAIAYHCQEVYLSNPGRYDDYIPISMLGASNDFYNFMLDSYHVFKKENGTTLKAAWEMYKTYCDDAKVPYPYSQRTFKEEMKNYFYEFNDRFNFEDGSRVRSYYSGFRTDKFEVENTPKKTEAPKHNLIEFDSTESIFDKVCSDCFAQYASDKGTPLKKWDNVTTTLSKLDTSKLHYVKVPENHIVIDFDIPDKDGNKCYERNLEEASKWPATYAEVSKSGQGIHLHYIYTGDPTKLSSVYDDHIEVKVYSGKGSLRRKLTKCNNLPIATISSGLPLKGEKMVNFEAIKSEKAIRTLIKRNLNKEIHSSTKCSIDFIYKILEDSYNDGVKYDVSDMQNAVLAFAANSTNQADYCIKLVNDMKFKSDEPSANVSSDDDKIVFYDVEVFPNLFVICWKVEGDGNPIVRMINPSPTSVEELMRFRLVGFNCRKYDNHILYARLMGYTNEQLYKLSQKIINDKSGFFGEAYNISYTDIYDFSIKKQSLKKWEIELGIHHQELGLPWDKPVPENMRTKVAEYCDNDVIATEAVFKHLASDFLAREILADLAGMTVNDTTNSLTTRIIFGTNRKPQDQFNYRDMGLPSSDDITFDGFDEYTRFDRKGRPIFPGYEYKYGKSTYRGEEVGEGGYVYAEEHFDEKGKPYYGGMYSNVALLDIASMHPTSIEQEELFGPIYTKRFGDLRRARLAVKHGEFDEARQMMDGKLAKYLTNEDMASNLSGALKLPINSVYGLTSAKFDNPFRDPRNIDNIVAKRGALFMINLKYEVQKRGYTVVHIKTDSIKIADATPEIIQFVMDYGELYGYTFEHEATYEKMCLVNNAVYIAKYADGKHAGEWTATGAQFAAPYVFKTLFSKEPIEFSDLCEVKEVKSAIYLDMNEQLPDVGAYEKEYAKLWKDISNTNLPDNAEMIRKCERVEELSELMAEGHDYRFVGKVGNFCPIKPGCGGGLLMRSSGEKYDSVVGTKGYRWLESEAVELLEKQDCIDRSYYRKLVDDAIEAISKYGDFEWFVA